MCQSRRKLDFSHNRLILKATFPDVANADGAFEVQRSNSRVSAAGPNASITAEISKRIGAQCALGLQSQLPQRVSCDVC